MIGGVDSERGTVTAGGRGYYLMVIAYRNSFTVWKMEIDPNSFAFVYDLWIKKFALE